MKPIDKHHMLLVHPLGYPARDAGKDISRVANIMPPLGLAGLAAYLKQNGIKTAIVDGHAQPDADRRIREYLETHRPGFIGFSCTTSGFLDGIRLAKLAKAISPEIKTVFGGSHVSALKETLLTSFPVIDFSVIGEGEAVLTKLIQTGEDNPHAIRGLVFRESSGDIVFTGYPLQSLKLDDLPFPAYEQLDGFPERYALPIFNYPAVPNTSCISSRGCPYTCGYCDRSVYRRTFRYNSAEYVYAHLKYLRERFNIRHINFYDDQFTFNGKRVEYLADRLIRSPLGITFNCAVRAEHVDHDLLKRLKAAGCWMISIGIETGDEILLSRHRQHADLDMLSQKIRLIKKAGIRVKGLLMMGLPGETDSSIQKTRKYVAALGLDDFNLSKFTPFPGSPLYEKIRQNPDQYGTFDEDWNKMDCMHFLFVTRGMTRARLESQFTQFYKWHLTRPSTMLGYIKMAWRSPDSWKRFLANLPRFIRFAVSDQRYEGSRT